MEHNKLNQFSIEAQIIACSWLVMPGAKQKTISFNRPWVITERCQKGLDELEQHGYIEKHYRNHYPDCPVDYVATEKLANCQMPLSFEDCKKHGFPFTY